MLLAWAVHLIAVWSFVWWLSHYQPALLGDDPLAWPGDDLPLALPGDILLLHWARTASDVK